MIARAGGHRCVVSAASIGSMTAGDGVGGRGELLRPPRLRPGDTVRFVSPASTPERAAVEHAVGYLTSLGLTAEVAPHAFDSWGYLAGRDADRLGDLNDALRDRHVRGVFATRGGKGAYRIADQLDFDAARADPKLLLGFSDITVLHMALLERCGLAAVHGACWPPDRFGIPTAASFERAVLTTEAVRLDADVRAPTAVLTTSGAATGPLIGGNQDAIATAAGWALPSLDGAILLLEAENQRLGHIDRQLTMLTEAGHLRGLRGVVVGQYTNCEPDATTQGAGRCSMCCATAWRRSTSRFSAASRSVTARSRRLSRSAPSPRWMRAPARSSWKQR